MVLPLYLNTISSSVLIIKLQLSNKCNGVERMGSNKNNLTTIILSTLGAGLLSVTPVTAQETQDAEQQIWYFSEGQLDANTGDYSEQPTLFLRTPEQEMTYIDVVSEQNDVETLDAYLMRSRDDGTWGGFYGVQNAASFTPRYIETRNDLIEDSVADYKSLVEDRTRSRIQVTIQNYLDKSQQVQEHPPEQTVETPFEERPLTFYVSDVTDPSVQYVIYGSIDGTTNLFFYQDNDRGIYVNVSNDPSSVVRGSIQDLVDYTYSEVMDRFSENQENVHDQVEY